MALLPYPRPLIKLTSMETPHLGGHSQPRYLSWSPILFNLYIRHLPTQILHCAFLQYADDSTLIKVVPSKDDRIVAADEMNADLVRIYLWGRMWNINFEPAKCHSLCVSLKRDTDLHPPLFMATLPIEEVDVLKILGVYFDRKLTWGHMIDQLTVRCRQRLGALFRVREYLGQSGLAIAYKSFVRPVCEYGCVIFMGASAMHLHKLDAVQKAAERLCQISFQPLSSRRKAGAIGLLCKLLDSHCQQPLQNFSPTLVSVTHPRCLRYISDDPLLLRSSVKYNSLDLFIRSFLGAISTVWSTIPLALRERGAVEGWSAVRHFLQRHLN